jgi:glycosyltransferase involved in cell wall biosynthesis
MKIGVDISQIVYQGTGVGRFIDGFVNSIVKYENDHDWILFFSALRQKLDRDLEEKINNKENIQLIKIFLPPKILSFFWNKLRFFPVESITGKLDWFVTSDWTEPPASCKKATIVHDLVFKVYPETVHNTIKNTQKARLNLIEKESDLIFTDSFSTAEDLKKYYRITQNKIVVNYPGVNIPQVNLKQDDFKKLCKKYSLKQLPFLLTVGKIEPRKNIEFLIKVFSKLIAEKKIDSQMQLLIAGPDGWGKVKTAKTDKIKFLGYVPDEDLYIFYKLSTAFVYPSIYEGFGYPVAEAMLSGCPVISSDVSSLKELGGNGAAALFNPEDESSLEKAILKTIRDEVFRKSLIKTGFTQAKNLSWEKYIKKFAKHLYAYRS